MTDTSIQWTDKTWNPVRGCSRVSPGCSNCYAMRQAHRFSNPGGPYEGLTVLRKGKVDWRGHARLVPEMLGQPLRWRKPARIFVNSMSDLFHSSLTDEEIAAVFGVMASSPEHTFQVLTKRPERMLEWFKWVNAAEDDPYTTCLREAAGWIEPSRWERVMRDTGFEQDFPEFEPWPLPNVWLGVSVEDQKTANERINRLLDVPAAIRFISAEPLLEHIDLNHLPNGMFSPFSALRRWTDGKTTTGLDWVIVGGESGHGARPCDSLWISSVVEQCAKAGVPCFVKQLGSLSVVNMTTTGQFRDGPNGKRQLKLDATRLQWTDKAGGDPSEWPDDLQVRQFPGGAA